MKIIYSLFFSGSGSTFVALLVYVDDIIITGAYVKIIQALKVHLNDVFKLKHIEDLHYFLGLELARSSQDIFLLMTLCTSVACRCRVVSL